MRILKVVSIVGLVFLFSCVSNEKETPSGMKFKVVRKGDGVLPQPGEVVVFKFLFKDSKDSIWAQMTDDLPAAVLTQDSTAIDSEDGMTQMLRMVSKGDSVVVSMPIKDFFKDLVRSEVPDDVDSTLTLSYHIRIDSIMPQMQFMMYQQEMMNRFREKQLAKDIAEIDQYLTERNIEAVKTESGIRYVINTPGTGENAASGQAVTVNYSGYLLDGQYFDSSVQSVAQERGIYNPMRPYEPYEVTIDQTSVIQGWHESLKYLNKGAKGTFYIPSSLAYGPQQRSEVIKENSILVFDLEVLEIK
ncbi:MAG: FKBP-type peptidyl-prolyl cis-trans isomerase [Cyclobacteriaceae bacterium]|nr:FKBP-type peptidyl-prolyl cis-trans isomerase [Cyclobacteriaceae bacterium]